MLCYQIYKSTSAKKKQKPILVNTGTNTLNMANVATNTMTTKELLAPLASMEDLSVCMTPMSTPGASPRTRARWSQRSSSRHVFTNFPNTNLRSFSTNYTVSSTTKWMKLNYTQSPLIRTTAKLPTLGVLKNSSNLDAHWFLIPQV